MTRRPSRSERQADAGAGVPASATSQIPAGALTASARRGPTDMGAVGPRYQYLRFHDRQHWIVVDTAARETVGYAHSAWDAGRAADRLNRGLPVYYAEDAA